MSFQTNLRKRALEIEDIFGDEDDREIRFEALLNVLAEVWEAGREAGYESAVDETECDCSGEWDEGYEEGYQAAREEWE